MDALVGTAYFCIVRIPARNKHEYGNIRFEKQAAVPVLGRWSLSGISAGVQTYGWDGRSKKCLVNIKRADDENGKWQ